MTACCAGVAVGLGMTVAAKRSGIIVLACAVSRHSVENDILFYKFGIMEPIDVLLIFISSVLLLGQRISGEANGT